MFYFVTVSQRKILCSPWTINSLYIKNNIVKPYMPMTDYSKYKSFPIIEFNIQFRKNKQITVHIFLLIFKTLSPSPDLQICISVCMKIETYEYALLPKTYFTYLHCTQKKESSKTPEFFSATYVLIFKSETCYKTDMKRKILHKRITHLFLSIL